MHQDELAKNAALVSLDLTRHLLNVLIAKDVLSATEATNVLTRCRAQLDQSGRTNMVKVLDLYFKPEIENQSWIQRDALYRGDPEGTA